MRVICTICARGGSQGVKNKNLLNLRGRPLIAHTLLQAKKSNLFDAITVSSDSKKIRDIAKKFGADYLIDRPKDMATSTAAKLPVIQHAVLETERLLSVTFDMIVDLDVTSPLRTVNDLCEAYQAFITHHHALNLVTAYPARRSPYFNMLEVGKDGYVKLAKSSEQPIIRRQDSPLCYDMNASIYIWKREALFNYTHVITDRTLLYVMPEERSVDIDSKLDLKMVRLLAKERMDFNDNE